jgi:SNF2 family DNA or RNA helicase
VPATPEDVPLPQAPLSELKPLHDPNAPGALVLCTAAEALSLGKGARGVAVVVDPFLARKLRPHQKQGVRWMYRAIHGFSPVSPETGTPPSSQVAIDHAGCLLADDMGLGKSLQSLALIWTMLRQGPHGAPTVKRALLVCPASLVGNWAAEVSKWLGGVRAQAALAEGGGADEAYRRWAKGAPANTKSAFDKWPILVTSYETLRRLAPVAAAARPEVMVCDEAHRLRNAQRESQTLSALRAVKAPMRVLLTGTPVQNNLDEYAAVMEFACPGLLGPPHDFHRRFTQPVRRGGEPGASARDVEEAKRAARELAELTKKRVLRREASINAAHLPAKTEMVVFCKPAEAQRALYEEGARVVREWTRGGGGGSTAAALCAIGILRQLANSVDQAMGVGRLAALRAKAGRRRDDGGGDGDGDDEDEDDVDEDDEDETRARKRARSGEVSEDEERVLDETDVALGGSVAASDPDMTADLRRRLASLIPKDFGGGAEGSGKLGALRAIVKALRDAGEGERVVIVSGFSAALDLAGAVCADLGVRTDRLDGRTPPDARSALVKAFNAGRGGTAMLLSCVAGGAGLNLVGASRLVLFDTSWNPAHDRQAMARVWRDGQTRPVTIYRLLAAGTVEEKVFQRQLLKRAEAEAAGVGDGAGDGGEFLRGDESAGIGGGKFSRDELGALVAFSSAATPVTLAAVGWRDERASVDDAPLRAAVDEDASAVTAVVRLAGDDSRAKALAAAEAAAARPRAKTGPKRLAFSELLSKAKQRGGQ